MGIIRQFVDGELVGALVARYRAAVRTEGADVGAARGAIENEFIAQQRDDRKELSDFLDEISEPAAGKPRGIGGSNFDKCRRPNKD